MADATCSAAAADAHADAHADVPPADGCRFQLSRAFAWMALWLIFAAPEKAYGRKGVTEQQLR